MVVSKMKLPDWGKERVAEVATNCHPESPSLDNTAIGTLCSLHVLVSKGVPTIVAMARRPHSVFDPDHSDSATASWRKEEVGADAVQTSRAYSGFKPWRVEA
jgi:hypothetical protein